MYICIVRIKYGHLKKGSIQRVHMQYKGGGSSFPLLIPYLYSLSTLTPTMGVYITDVYYLNSPKHSQGSLQYTFPHKFSPFLNLPDFFHQLTSELTSRQSPTGFLLCPQVLYFPSPSDYKVSKTRIQEECSWRQSVEHSTGDQNHFKSLLSGSAAGSQCRIGDLYIHTMILDALL